MLSSVDHFRGQKHRLAFANDIGKKFISAFYDNRSCTPVTQREQILTFILTQSEFDTSRCHNKIFSFVIMCLAQQSLIELTIINCKLMSTLYIEP